MDITKWKKPVWKDYILCDANSMTFRKKYGDSKKKWGLEGQDLRGFVGQWLSSACCYNSGYVSLYIYLNP